MCLSFPFNLHTIFFLLRFSIEIEINTWAPANDATFATPHFNRTNTLLLLKNSGGKCRVGKFLGGELSGGEVSGGELSSGKVSVHPKQARGGEVICYEA